MKNIPENTLSVMLESLSGQTQKQYNTVYKSWWAYCSENEVPIFSAGVPEVISFLQKQFENSTVRYGTFNSYRSALSLILPGNIGQNPEIRRFLKGISRLRPQRPKYDFIWNPQKVLNYLSSLPPNEDLPLEKLTKKLVTLLALTTGHRIQTLSFIRIQNVIFSESEIQILIPDAIKTSGPNKIQPCLVIPYFSENPQLCVAAALAAYIDATLSLRDKSQEYLFLTLKPPHNRASSQTLSRWIKDTLGKSGIDTTVFSAYSTRHSSTSAAYRAGISLDVIRKTAGWTQKSRTFATFYNRPLLIQNNFAKATLTTAL